MQTITFISRKPTPSRVALGNVMDNHAETLRFKLSRRQGEFDLAGAIPALHLQGKGILALESALDGDWVVVDCPVTALFTGRALRHTASLRFTLPDGQAWGSDDFELEVNARTDESQPVEQQTDWNLVDATLLAAREAEVAARIAREVKNGKSAYELALEDGYTGTKEQWFQSLRGGEGKSAYEVALEEGFEGTPQQWLGTLGGLAEVARLESKLGRSFDTSGEVSYTHELSPQPGGYAYTTSTFSGWGCAIGRPTQLNRLTFRIKARTSSPSPTSKVRMVLRMGDKDGSILAEYTDEQLSVAPGAYLDYQWCFDKVKNTAGSMFYFNYYTDQPCDCFKVELPELPGGSFIPRPHMPKTTQ